MPIAEIMRAWVLGDPNELKLVEKPVPVAGRAEILVRVDAVAICATDLEIMEYGTPAIKLGSRRRSFDATEPGFKSSAASGDRYHAR